MARAMKDSGIAWIGEIADGFEVIKLKYLSDILDQYRSPITADQRNQDADVLYDYYGASGAIDKIDGYTINDHVMLIGEDGANLKMRNLPLMYEVNGKAWINNHAHILKPKSEVDFYYLFYALEALDLNTYITGSAQPKLSQENLKNIWIPIPQHDVQIKILMAIREKCQDIDALIEQTRASIEEYKKLKQAVITQAVTKGIRPNRPMKEVYEFEASIPDSWAMVRLKYLTTEIVDCPHETPEYSNNGEYLVIRTADQDYARLRPDESMYRLDLSEYQNRIRRLSLDRDDIVYGREGERWGLACLVPESGKNCLGQRMMQFRCDESRILPMFAVYALSSIYVHRQGEFDTFGSTSPHVNISTIRNYKLPLPPLGEQEEIQSYLDRKSAEIDGIIAKKERYLSEVQSFKKSLIFEYVTGKKEAI